MGNFFPLYLQCLNKHFDTLALLHYVTYQVRFYIFQEFCRVLRRYWYFQAIALGLNMTAYFASTDINLGVDGTQSFKWISHEGWIHLFYNSNNFTEQWIDNQSKNALIWLTENEKWRWIFKQWNCDVLKKDKPHKKKIVYFECYSCLQHT